MTATMQKHSCVICARRKVRCDKLSPCSDCSRTQSECVYGAPVPSQRHRKRLADEDLVFKLREYEDLLRNNNIKFRPLDNSWISSPLEEKLVSSSQTIHPEPLQTLRKVDRALEAHGSKQESQPDLLSTQSVAARLWSGLPKELRNFPIDKLKRSSKDLEDEVVETSSSSGIATSLLISVRLDEASQLLELHPEPKHIFKLWQAFLENINPLTKVIHAPTLQQRILEVSWNLETVKRPVEAIMFAVYALAITSMEPRDCVHAFGETRSILLNRYRSGAAQALIAARLHSTSDLEVLQAFVLFLLIDPRSELSLTVVAVATRIGHRMGLHRTGADPHMSFFEQEMRLRVWWQVISLDSRARRKMLSLTLSLADYGHVRMPLNINDAELHPHMTQRPVVEHPGATEMLYCLMKYEVEHYVRSSLAAAAVPTTNHVIASTSPEGMAKKKKVLADLDQIYEARYLAYCDPSIPLHHVSATLARLNMHHVRFWCHHPRHQPEGGRNMSQAEQDLVFESSMQLLTLHFDLRGTNFSVYLLDYLLPVRPEAEVLVYMISELRQRVSGDMVQTAWDLVGRMYEEYPQLLQSDDKFNTALADLTLEAWEARRREVQLGEDAVPVFIRVLQGRRGNVESGDTSTAIMGSVEPYGDLDFGLGHDDPLDWVCWNDISQL